MVTFDPADNIVWNIMELYRKESECGFYPDAMEVAADTWKTIHKELENMTNKAIIPSGQIGNLSGMKVVVNNVIPEGYVVFVSEQCKIGYKVDGVGLLKNVQGLGCSKKEPDPVKKKKKPRRMIQI